MSQIRHRRALRSARPRPRSDVHEGALSSWPCAQGEPSALCGYCRCVSRATSRVTTPRRAAETRVGTHTDFEAVLEQDPDSAEARKALEETLTLINKRDDSDEDHECFEIDPTFPSLSEKMAELESVSDSSDWNHEGNGIPCRFYNHDGCMRGTECKFSHTPDHKSARDRLCAFSSTFRLRGGTLTLDYGQRAQRLYVLSTRGLQIWQQRVRVFPRQDLLALRPLVGQRGQSSPSPANFHGAKAQRKFRVYALHVRTHRQPPRLGIGARG